MAISDNGRLIQRLESTHGAAGAIQRNALIGRPYGCLSAVADADGNLFLIAWSLGDDGRLERGGDSGDKQAGTAHLVEVVAMSRGGHAPVVTAIRSGRPSLLLLSWDDRPDHGELTL